MLHLNRMAAIRIQRYMRGFLASQYVKNIKFQKQDERNIEFFNFHAQMIQKV